jgi:nuclear GTP-binding protein
MSNRSRVFSGIPGTATGGSVYGGTATSARSVAASQALSRTTCFGAAALLEVLKNYTRANGVKRHINVGVVGYPNVGKSSIINSVRSTSHVFFLVFSFFMFS